MTETETETETLPVDAEPTPEKTMSILVRRKDGVIFPFSAPDANGVSTHAVSSMQILKDGDFIAEQGEHAGKWCRMIDKNGKKVLCKLNDPLFEEVHKVPMSLAKKGILPRNWMKKSTDPDEPAQPFTSRIKPDGVPVELDDFSREELLAQAKAMGIGVPPTMKTPTLIRLIKNRQQTARND